MIRLKPTTLLAMLLLLFTACEKKFLEIIPVMQVEQDMSIAGAGAIKIFSFPSEQVGYAAEDAAYIYKTKDGGKTWVKQQVGKGQTIKQIEFFDAFNGMVLAGEEIYFTDNGGDTWTLRQYGQFIGITDKGIGLYGSCSFRNCAVRVSSDKGKTFQSGGNVFMGGYYERAYVVGSKVFVEGTSTSTGSGGIFGLNLVTKGEELLHFPFMGGQGNYITDFFMNEYSDVVVSTNGLMYQRDITSNFGYSRSYYTHKYAQKSVSGYNERLFAAGIGTVSVNIDYGEGEHWSELLDAHGKRFKQVFLKVKAIDKNRFYLSGNDGLLWRVKI